MAAKHLPHAIAICLAIAAGPAKAHGESHAAPKAFDASKVEQTSFGRAGDPGRVDRTIRVAMSDAMRFTPSVLEVKQGETVRFVLANRGKLLHEMVLGTAQDLKKHAQLMRNFPGMQHEDANMAHVKPGRTGELVWRFTQPGKFAFACLVPGHFEAGMTGTVVVR